MHTVIVQKNGKQILIAKRRAAMILQKITSWEMRYGPYRLAAERFAKCVMLEWNGDVRAEKNFFDITCGGTTVRIIGAREDILSEKPRITSVYNVQ